MEFKRSRLLTPCPLEFRESAYRGRESWFMILAVEQRLVPPFQEKINLKQREIGGVLENLCKDGRRRLFEEWNWD
jgi:hypothetical protein